MNGEKAESVHLLDMPELVEYNDGKEILELFDLFFELKDIVNKKIAILRDEEKVVGSSLEVVLKINGSGKYKLIKEKLSDCLQQLFVVSKVEFTEDGEEVYAERTNGHKCERCWNYVDELHEGNICERCKSVIE